MSEDYGLDDLDLGGLLGLVGGDEQPTQRRQASSMGSMLADNAGLLGTVGVLSVLANNNGRRGVGQLLGRAGLDALGALGQAGMVGMQQDRLDAQNAATRADRALNRQIQLQNLALRQAQFNEEYGGGSLFDGAQMPQAPVSGAPSMPAAGGAQPISGGDLFGDLSGVNVAIPQQYEQMVKDASAKTGVPEQILRAVMMTESGGDMSVVSKAGARGLMQLMPKWHPAEAMTDPYLNILEGAKQLAEYNKLLGGNWDHTLKAYNWGIGNINSYLRNGHGLTSHDMPKETQDYVGRVMGFINKGRNGAQPAAHTQASPAAGSLPAGAQGGFLPPMLRSRLVAVSMGTGKRAAAARALLQMDVSAQNQDMARTIQRTQAEMQASQLALQRQEAERKAQERDPAFQRTKAMNEADMKRFDKLQDDLKTLTESGGNLQVLEQLLSGGLKTGPWQEKRDAAGRFLAALGMDPTLVGGNNLRDAEMFKSLVETRVFDILKEQTGVQTEGDAQRARNVWASLGNSPEGNRWINQLARNVNQRKIEQTRFLLDKMHGGMSHYEATKEWEKHVASLPYEKQSLLPKNTADLERRIPGATSGGGQGGGKPTLVYDPKTGTMKPKE